MCLWPASSGFISSDQRTHGVSSLHNLPPGCSKHTSVWLEGVSFAEVEFSWSATLQSIPVWGFSDGLLWDCNSQLGWIITSVLEVVLGTHLSLVFFFFSESFSLSFSAFARLILHWISRWYFSPQFSTLRQIYHSVSIILVLCEHQFFFSSLNWFLYFSFFYLHYAFSSESLNANWSVSAGC